MPADLVTIAGVELVAVGVEWPASTGLVTFTAEDLAAAVAAQDDPHLRTPVVKLGHTDPRFDGEPAVGRVEHLRLSADGMTMLGDLVGVPAWLAEVIESAYPSRSVEGAFNVRTAGGTRHRFIVEGLALLGVAKPALEHLADVKALYDPQPEVVAASRVTVRLEGALMPKPAPGRVAASVNLEDIRRAYYDAQPTGSWAWVREVWSDFLIVDDDDGGLWRVPWSGDTADAISFGTPVRVRVEYVEAPDAEKTPALLSRARPHVEPELLDRARRHKAAGSPTSKEARMDPAKLREALGLAPDATDDEVRAKLAEAKLVDPAPAPTTEPAPQPDPKPAPAAPAGLPDGVVAVDQGTLEQLQVAAKAGQEAKETLRVQERGRFLGAAVKAGKFPPARLEHWQGLYDRDEAGTREFVERSLAAGTVPLAEVGHGGAPEGTDDAALWAEMAKLGLDASAMPKER